MNAMERETARRRGFARQIVESLEARTPLRAAMLAGSAAQGISDEHSDVDLIAYYDELPGPAVVSGLMSELGASPIGSIGPARPDGFAARHWMDGVEIQLGATAITALERHLDRIASGDVDWITAKVAMGLGEGLPLHGSALVDGWRRRAAYPESLRWREVERNLGFFPIWAIDEHLAARDAELFRRQMLLEGAFRVLAILSAINRLYFTSFQFKRARAHISQMAVSPVRLADRLDDLANAAPGEAAQVLEALVEDTKGIVRSELPEVDIDVPWRPAL